MGKFRAKRDDVGQGYMPEEYPGPISRQLYKTSQVLAGTASRKYFCSGPREVTTYCVWGMRGDKRYALDDRRIDTKMTEQTTDRIWNNRLVETR